MSRPPFITLAFIAVMLQVMTFGACRPRPKVEVFLPSGVVAAVIDHHHPHAGDHHHDDHRHGRPTHGPIHDHTAPFDGPIEHGPDHVHLWDIGPVAPRPDRDALPAPASPALAVLPMEPEPALGPARMAPGMATIAGAFHGLRTTRLLI